MKPRLRKRNRSSTFSVKDMRSSVRERNIVAAACYVPIFSIVVSVVILIVEKEDRFIRFHAMQSLMYSLGYYLFVIFIGGLPFIGGLVLGLAFLISLGVWIFGIITAYSGWVFKLPLIGKYAERRAG